MSLLQVKTFPMLSDTCSGLRAPLPLLRRRMAKELATASYSCLLLVLLLLLSPNALVAGEEETVPKVNKIRPTSGSIMGGTLVTIYGENLAPSTGAVNSSDPLVDPIKVQLGGAFGEDCKVIAYRSDATQIVCEAPNMAPSLDGHILYQLKRGCMVDVANIYVYVDGKGGLLQDTSWNTGSCATWHRSNCYYNMMSRSTTQIREVSPQVASPGEEVTVTGNLCFADTYDVSKLSEGEKLTSEIMNDEDVRISGLNEVERVAFGEYECDLRDEYSQLYNVTGGGFVNFKWGASCRYGSFKCRLPTNMPTGDYPIKIMQGLSVTDDVNAARGGTGFSAVNLGSGSNGAGGETSYVTSRITGNKYMLSVKPSISAINATESGRGLHITGTALTSDMRITVAESRDGSVLCVVTSADENGSWLECELDSSEPRTLAEIEQERVSIVDTPLKAFISSSAGGIKRERWGFMQGTWWRTYPLDTENFWTGARAGHENHPKKTAQAFRETGRLAVEDVFDVKMKTSHLWYGFPETYGRHTVMSVRGIFPVPATGYYRFPIASDAYRPYHRLYQYANDEFWTSANRPKKGWWNYKWNDNFPWRRFEAGELVFWEGSQFYAGQRDGWGSLQVGVDAAYSLAASPQLEKDSPASLVTQVDVSLDKPLVYKYTINSATGGSYTLSLGTSTTAVLKYNAGAGAIKTAFKEMWSWRTCGYNADLASSSGLGADYNDYISTTDEQDVTAAEDSSNVLVEASSFEGADSVWSGASFDQSTAGCGRASMRVDGERVPVGDGLRKVLSRRRGTHHEGRYLSFAYRMQSDTKAAIRLEFSDRRFGFYGQCVIQMTWDLLPEDLWRLPKCGDHDVTFITDDKWHLAEIDIRAMLASEGNKWWKSTYEPPEGFIYAISFNTPMPPSRRYHKECGPQWADDERSMKYASYRHISGTFWVDEIAFSPEARSLVVVENDMLLAAAMEEDHSTVQDIDVTVSPVQGGSDGDYEVTVQVQRSSGCGGDYERGIGEGNPTLTINMDNMKSAELVSQTVESGIHRRGDVKIELSGPSVGSTPTTAVLGGEQSPEDWAAAINTLHPSLDVSVTKSVESSCGTMSYVIDWRKAIIMDGLDRISINANSPEDGTTVAVKELQAGHTHEFPLKSTRSQFLIPQEAPGVFVRTADLSPVTCSTNAPECDASLTGILYGGDLTVGGKRRLLQDEEDVIDELEDTFMDDTGDRVFVGELFDEESGEMVELFENHTDMYPPPRPQNHIQELTRDFFETVIPEQQEEEDEEEHSDVKRKHFTAHETTDPRTEYGPAKQHTEDELKKMVAHMPGHHSIGTYGELRTKAEDRIARRRLLAEGEASTGEFLFSDPAAWGGATPDWENVEIMYVPIGTTLTLDQSIYIRFWIIEGTLKISEAVGDIVMEAQAVIVNGPDAKFLVGTETEPFPNEFELLLHGTFASYTLPKFGIKTLAMTDGEVVLHGKPVEPTWSLLAQTAEAGATSIVMQGSANWKAGDKIVIAGTRPRDSSACRLDRQDDCQSEERILTGVASNSDGTTTLSFETALSYEHLGITYSAHGRSIEMRAEVMHLTRNVRIRGKAQAASFGSHVMVLAGKVTWKYLETTYAGQSFQLGRYALHLHTVGQPRVVGGSDQSHSIVKGCAIHHSFNRALTAHAVHNLKVEDNVAYNCMGHQYFIEDGIETGNTYTNNVGLMAHASFSLLGADQTPANFWITNPNNNFVDNRAAGAAAHGFWFDVFRQPTGPSATKPGEPLIYTIHAHMGEFRNNVAHGSGMSGYWITNLDPTEDETPASPRSPALLLACDAWANGIGLAVREGNGHLQFVDWKFAANNGAQASFVDHGSDRWWSESNENAFVFESPLFFGGAPMTRRKKSGVAIAAPFRGYFTVNRPVFMDYGSKAIIKSCDGNCKPWKGGMEHRYRGVEMPGKEPGQLISWGSTFMDNFIYDEDGTLSGMGRPYWIHNKAKWRPDNNATASSYTGYFDPSVCMLDERDIFTGGILCDPEHVSLRSFQIMRHDLGNRAAIISTTFGHSFAPFWHYDHIGRRHNLGFTVFMRKHTEDPLIHHIEFGGDDRYSYDNQMYSWSRNTELREMLNDEWAVLELPTLDLADSLDTIATRKELGRLPRNSYEKTGINEVAYNRSWSKFSVEDMAGDYVYLPGQNPLNYGLGGKLQMLLSGKTTPGPVPETVASADGFINVCGLTDQGCYVNRRTYPGYSVRGRLSRYDNTLEACKKLCESRDDCKGLSWVYVRRKFCMLAIGEVPDVDKGHIGYFRPGRFGCEVHVKATSGVTNLAGDLFTGASRTFPLCTLGGFGSCDYSPKANYPFNRFDCDRTNREKNCLGLSVNCIDPTLPSPNKALEPKTFAWCDANADEDWKVPSDGEDVIILEGWTVYLDSDCRDTAKVRFLDIYGTLELRGDARVKPHITLRAEMIHVGGAAGKLEAGTPDVPFQGLATIELHGDRTSLARPSVYKAKKKYMLVFGELSLHGVPQAPSQWTRLTKDAASGALSITVDGEGFDSTAEASNAYVGARIAIGTSGHGWDGHAWSNSEVRTVTSVSYATQSDSEEDQYKLEFDEPLEYDHKGPGSGLNAGVPGAEVGLLGAAPGAPKQSFSVQVVGVDSGDASSKMGTAIADQRLGAQISIVQARGKNSKCTAQRIQGKALISGVRFLNCGQGRQESACLLWAGTWNTDPEVSNARIGAESYVKHSVFENIFTSAIQAFGAFNQLGLRLSDNFIYDVFSDLGAISVSGNYARVTRNLVMHVKDDNPNYYFGVGAVGIAHSGEQYVSNKHWPKNETLRVSVFANNAVAGSQYNGIKSGGYGCGDYENTIVSANFEGNVAHSVKRSALLMGDAATKMTGALSSREPQEAYPSSYKNPRCGLHSGYVLYNAGGYGAATYMTSSALWLVRSVLYNNWYGITGWFNGGDWTNRDPNLHLMIADSTIIAEPSRCRQKGVVPAVFYRRTEPYRPNQAGNAPSVSGGTVVRNVKFSGFGKCPEEFGTGEAKYNKCIDNDASDARDSLIWHDSTSQVTASKLTFDTVAEESKVGFHPSPLSTAMGNAPRDRTCAQMACDGKRNTIIHDLDGTLIGGGASYGTVVSQNSERRWNDPLAYKDPEGRETLGDLIPRQARWPKNGMNAQQERTEPLTDSELYEFPGNARANCEYNAAWDAYSCAEGVHRHIVLESLDADFMSRRYAPVAVNIHDKPGHSGLRDGQSFRYMSLYTGASMYGLGWNTKISRSSTMTITGSLYRTHDIYLSGTNPQKQRLSLKDATPDEALHVRIYYGLPNRVDAYVEGEKVEPLATPTWDRVKSGDLPPELDPTDPSLTNGAGYYNRLTGFFELILRGPEPVVLKVTEMVELKIGLAVTEDEFYKTGYQGLLRNLALLMDVPPSRIMIAGLGSLEDNQHVMVEVAVDPTATDKLADVKQTSNDIQATRQALDLERGDKLAQRVELEGPTSKFEFVAKERPGDLLIDTGLTVDDLDQAVAIRPKDIPVEWYCPDEMYMDGFCDCGTCGMWDPDCGTGSLTTSYQCENLPTDIKNATAVKAYCVLHKTCTFAFNDTDALQTLLDEYDLKPACEKIDSPVHDLYEGRCIVTAEDIPERTTAGASSTDDVDVAVFIIVICVIVVIFSMGFFAYTRYVHRSVYEHTQALLGFDSGEGDAKSLGKSASLKIPGHIHYNTKMTYNEKWKGALSHMAHFMSAEPKPAAPAEEATESHPSMA